MRFLYLTLEDVSGEGRETKRVTTKIGISELEAYHGAACEVIADIVSKLDTQLTNDLKGKNVRPKQD
jgi:hypothetical protein